MDRIRWFMLWLKKHDSVLDLAGIPLVLVIGLLAWLFGSRVEGSLQILLMEVAPLVLIAIFFLYVVGIVVLRLVIAAKTIDVSEVGEKVVVLDEFNQILDVVDESWMMSNRRYARFKLPEMGDNGFLLSFHHTIDIAATQLTVLVYYELSLPSYQEGELSRRDYVQIMSAMRSRGSLNHLDEAIVLDEWLEGELKRNLDTHRGWYLSAHPSREALGEYAEELESYLTTTLIMPNYDWLDFNYGHVAVVLPEEVTPENWWSSRRLPARPVMR